MEANLIMSHLETGKMNEKFDGQDLFLVRQASRALSEVAELSKKPELLKAAQKYLKQEQREAEDAIDIAKNL